MCFPYKRQMIEYVFISENKKPSTILEDQNE